MTSAAARDELLRITRLTRAWLLEQPRSDGVDGVDSVDGMDSVDGVDGVDGLDTADNSDRPNIANIADADDTADTVDDVDNPAEALLALRAQIGDCARCAIAQNRHNLVFGQGNPRARLMIVGEGPGEQEDLQGIAFCGPSGELLTKMLAAIGLARDEVYIANVIKCRPPHNRDPLPEEVANCKGWLDAQIDIIRPRLLCSAGNIATKTLLNTQTGIMRLHGTLQSYHGTPLVPTFHPAFLLRDPTRKKDAWKDLQYIQRLLNEPET